MIEWLDWRLGGLGAYQLVRPLVVGLVHGLAGSAAVALLVLALIKDPWWAMAYLVVFGIRHHCRNDGDYRCYGSGACLRVEPFLSRRGPAICFRVP